MLEEPLEQERFKRWLIATARSLKKKQQQLQADQDLLTRHWPVIADEHYHWLATSGVSVISSLGLDNMLIIDRSKNDISMTLCSWGKNWPIFVIDRLHYLTHLSSSIKSDPSCFPPWVLLCTWVVISIAYYPSPMQTLLAPPVAEDENKLSWGELWNTKKFDAKQN